MRENTARPIQQDTSDDIDYIEQRAARAHHGEKKDVGSRLRQATEELQQARRFLKEQILSSDAAKNYPKTIISGTGRQAIEKSNEDNIVSLIIKKIVKSDPKNDWEEYIFGLNEDIERMEDEVEQLKKERKKEEQRDKVEGIDLTQLTEQTTAKANLQLVEDQQRVSDIREQISQVDQEQEKETRIFNLWNKLVALRRKLEGVKTGWFSKIEFQGDMPTVFNINNLKSGLALKGKYDIMALMRRNQLSDSANLTQFYDLSQQMEALLNERRQKEEQRRAANVARIHERTREKNRLAAAERKKAEEELNAEHADFWMSDENETINPHTGKKEDRTQLNAKLVMEEVNAKDEAEDTRYINESFMAEEADFERRAREEIKAEEAKKQKKDGLLKRIAKILGIGGAGAAALLAAERGTDQDNRKVELKITNQPAKIMELNAADMADLQQSDAKSILEEISNLDTTNPDKPVIKVNRTSSKPSTNKESGGASKKQAPAIDENNPSSQSEAGFGFQIPRPRTGGLSNNESSSGPSDVSGDTTRAARKKVRANEPLMVLDERPGENLFVNEQKPTSGTPTPTVQKPKLTDSGGIFQRLVKFGASPSVDRTVPGVSESLMNGRLNREEAYRIAEEILSTMQTKKGAPQEKLVNALMDLDIKTIFKFNNVPSAHAHSFSEALQYMRDAKDKSAGAERLTWMQRIIKIKDLMEKLRSRGISVE